MPTSTRTSIRFFRIAKPFFVFGYGCLLLLAGFITPASAQLRTLKGKDSTFCASPDLSDYQRKELDNMAKLAFQLRKTTDKAFTGIHYVPIRPHIFRTAAGKDGFDLARMNNAIALTNSYYQKNGVGIQFYLAGTSPDYIDNDAMFQVFTDFNEGGVDGRDATNALNMYFVNAFTTGGLQGYAYFPDNTLLTTRSFILATPTTENTLGNFLIPHELGHNFNLYHTFQGSTSSTPELVTRGDSANCTTAGDLLCDTPADPYGRSGSTFTSTNNCLVYTGTATDPKGLTYSPSMTNLMSYYNSCTHDFTQGQYDRMEAGLALRLSHSAYTLDFPPSPVTAPNQLTALAGMTGNVILSWRDNSSNEMGFFVERASSPEGPFIQIGGIAPNVTSFTDARTGRAGTYYYRIRPSNTTLGALSNVAVATISAAPACTLTPGIGCALGDGLNSIQLNGATLSVQSGCSPNAYQEFPTTSVSVVPGQTFSITGQFLNGLLYTGVSVWLDLNRDGQFGSNERLVGTGGTGNFSASFTIPAGLAAGPLAIRIAGVRGYSPAGSCDSYTYGETEDYTIQVAPANACPTISGLNTTSLTTSSAQLSWNATSEAFSYELRWKTQDASDWTIISGLSATRFQLTNLAAGTGYQWQVRAVCADGTSVYAGSAFATACPAPTALTTSQITASSAILSWSSAGEGRTYDLAWRPESSGTWNLVDGISTNTYSLTGLREGIGYVWQVRSLCTPTGSQTYVSPVSFKTQGTCRPITTYGCFDNDGLNSFTFNNQAITQSQGCSPAGYRTNTRINVPVTAGRPYSFSGTLLSSSYYEGICIWLDVNRNGIYETSERVFATPSPVTTSFSGSLTIPASTTAGLLPMRVIVAFGTIPYDPCGNYSYSETEDFLLNVYSTNTVQITQRTQPVCYNAPLAVSFATTIPFSQANIFSLQLSDNNGSFTSPTNLGSVTGSSGGSLTVTVPASIPASADYQLRVVSSSPALTDTPATPLTIESTCSCPVPTALTSTTNPTASSQYLLTWQCDASVNSFLVRWRIQGSSAWSSPVPVTDTQYLLTGLTGNKTYEWQVQTNCGNNQSSEWAVTATFQTQNCGVATISSTPLSLTAGQTLPISVSLTGQSPWNFTVYRNGSSWWTFVGMSSSPYTFTSTTYQSATYTIGSATNSCGTMETTGSLPVYVPCTTPASLTESDQSYTSVYLRWASVSGNNYQIQWRETGTATWNESGTYCCSSYYVSNLQNGKTYQWRIRSVCGDGSYSEWSAERTFTMVCPIPLYLSEQLAADKATLNWGYFSTPAGNSLTYNIRWRAVGTTAWTSLTSICCSSYTLQNLTKEQAYEWQIQTICPDGSTSAFTTPRQFTATCEAPVGLRWGNGTSTGITVSWNGQSGVNYSVRYRVRGTSDWTSVPGIGGTSCNLTGLSGNTTYEWQVQKICSAQDSSPFSVTNSFTTYCSSSYISNVFTTGNQATLNWYTYGNGTQYRLIYRNVSSPTSTTINSLTGSPYSLTGLTNGEVYTAQIQTICQDGITASLSSPRTFTITCTAPTYGGTNNSFGGIYWESLGTNITYAVQYRPKGSSTWPYSLTVASNTASLTGLTQQTGYEWQVRTLCSPGSESPWSSVYSFTTSTCPPVNSNSMSLYSLEGGSAVLEWYYGNTSLFYTVQWRPLGISEWTSFTTTQSKYQITGLSSGSTYEWRVQNNCSLDFTAPFSPINTFTTFCNSNIARGETYINPTQAEIYWYSQVGVQYQLRWRRVGTSSWITSSAPISSIHGYMFYTLPSLTTGAAYEWQIQVICSDGTLSGYSSSRVFTTQCGTVGFVNQLWTGTTAIDLVWGGPAQGAQYEIRWRPSGTTTWAGNATATTNHYVVSNLLPGTTYEFQVRFICDAAPWSYIFNIQTNNSCTYINTSLLVSKLTPESITLRLSYEPDKPQTVFTELYYKPLSESLYKQAMIGNNSVLTLNDLQPNTFYVISISASGCLPGYAGNSNIYIITPPATYTMYTVTSGNWDNPDTWSERRVPNSSDLLEIRHTVTVPANTTGYGKRIIYRPEGRISTGSGARLQLGF
nr:fibronectin type III domain-containing protein [uncultured Arsenicibacter sp.]